MSVLAGIVALGMIAGQDGGARASDRAPVTVLEDVVVAGRRGATDLTPERELGPDEIDALNAWDIGEVISRLGETLGGDEPPVVIINGRRILDPGNFTGFPPEAVSRVEVLPQEAAALYGEDPGRRVLNVVLVPEFRSRDGMAGAWAPTAGGASGVSFDVRQSVIQGDDTHQYGLQATRDTALWSDERPGYRGGALAGDDITLRPEGRSATANAAATGTLGDWTTSVTANLSRRTEAFTTANGDARQQGHSLNLNGGVGGEWAGWTLRGNISAAASEGRQSGLNDVRSRTTGMSAQLVATRPLFTLPGGPANLSLNGRWSRVEARTRTPGADIGRSSTVFDARAGLGLPLTRAPRRGRPGTGAAGGATGGFWGDTTLTLGAQARQSDSSDLRGGVNGALSWSPSRRFRFSGQWAASVDGPSDSQLFDPVISAPPRTIFDFRTGEAVEIAPLIGGNPDLRSQRQDRFVLSAVLGPFTDWRLQTNVTWARQQSTDAIGALPILSPAAEAAFPERFVRDVDGRLIGIDQRPINLAEARNETLSLILNMTVPLGEPGEGRALQVGLNRNWRLTDTLMIREGYPVLDRLAGDGGGAGRDQTDLRFDLRLGALGVNLQARRRAGGRVRRDIGVDGPDDLRLKAFTTADLTITYRFAPRRGEDAGSGGSPDRDPGLRLEFEISNLFDARPGAVLGDGRPAPGYGRDDQDPLGRVARVSLRSRF